MKDGDEARKTAAHLRRKKECGAKIVVLTCYDYPTAVWQEGAGVDVIFVGDSVGTNVLGYEHERQVTMDDMLHHLRAVRRGVSHAFLLADLPYLSYETPAQALENARRLLDCGAEGVKLEGSRTDIIRHLAAEGIVVWGHLGLNPQLHERKVLQATTVAAAVELVDSALAVERAGASFVVLELIPEEVARAATERLAVPTIGIGAGRYTDGQVLIVLDLLGVNTFELRHVARYEHFDARARAAIEGYVEDVRGGRFPAREQVWRLRREERERFAAWARGEN